MYDTLTGPEGMSVDDYKGLWESMRMPSTSDSDYGHALRNLVVEVTARPSMYATSAVQLELILFGYSKAWTDLRGLDRREYLDRGFAVWLLERHGWSTSLGWGATIDHMALSGGHEGLDLALRLLAEYFGTLPTTSAKS